MTDTHSSTDKSAPIVTFYRAIPESFAPMRADRGALGVIPTAAFQYCEALTSASACGWYLFSPMTLYLQWDGTDVIWTHDDTDTWYRLTMEHFPNFDEYFDDLAPDDIKGYAPPFLSRSFFPGVVQIWSGFFVKTAPGWSLLLRPPVNLPRSQTYECYEGIIETDRWFGPLFTNLRFTRTHTPVRLREDFPLAQLQPLPRIAYAEATLRASESVGDMGQFTPRDWADYQTTIAEPNADPDRPFGAYAVAARRRGRTACPAAAA